MKNKNMECRSDMLAQLNALEMLDNIASSAYAERLEKECNEMIEASLLHSVSSEVRMLKRRIAGFGYLQRLVNGDKRIFFGKDLLDSARFSLSTDIADLLIR